MSGLLETLCHRFDKALLRDSEVYLVGGAVRDALLGLPVSDCDWLVVGMTPEQMVARGFVPVGEDFPVFLHPRTGEEYALARTERKIAKGYGGFQFYTGIEVSLEQDLLRRDLTINAIAMDRQGRLHDPFGGQADIVRKRLRHISPAFQEDPVRILRLARFLARFTEFEVDSGTQALCQTMVQQGEVHALQSQRVWKECARAWLAKRPSRMWQFLSEIGAAQIVFQGQVLACERLDHLPMQMSLSERFALIAQEAELSILKSVLSLPNDCEDLTQLSKKLKPLILSLVCTDVQAVLKVVDQGDILRRPERFFRALDVLNALGIPVDKAFWEAVKQVMAQVPLAQIAQQAQDRTQIPHLIRQAKCEALQQWLFPQSE